MKHQLHVLMVEDSEDDALLLTRQLQHGGFELHSERVETASSFVSALESKEWDIILCDYKMPKFDGMKALSIARERGIDVPFIFVSGTIGEDRAVEAMKTGAHDYVMKGNLKRLVPAIERELREAKVRKARTQAEEVLRNERLLLRTLIDNIPDAIYSKDTSCRKTLANPAEVRHMGLKSEAEVLGKDDFEFYPKDLAEGFFADDQSVLRTGQPVLNREEYVFEEKGKKRWLLTSKLPLREREGHIVGLVGIGRDITDRKRAEEELKTSEEKYRGIFENVQDVYFESSIEGTILEVSPSITLLSGGQYQRDDLIGKSMYDFYSESGDRQAFLAALQPRGRVTDFEIILKNRDGSQIFCSISAVIRIDDQGHPERIIGSLRNITERKRAEESQLLLTTALESTANGVAITDLKGNLVWVNKAFMKMTGYAWTELLGENPRILKSGRQDNSFYEHLWETISAGNVWTGELINKKKDGSLYTDEMTITPLKNKNGEITNFIAIKQDITERKRAVKEIESLSRFPAENPNPVLRVMEDGQIIYANKVSEALLRLWKCTVGEKLPPEWRDRVMNAARDRTRSTEEVVCEERSYSIIIAPILDTGYVNLYGIDITERVRAEVTRKSLEAQLQQAQKLESVGTLASGIAHDFNNILGIILGYSTLLERLREDPQKYSESVTAITKATQRGASLVKQLLIFARKTDALLESVRINDIIAEITKLLKDTFPKTITISTSLQQDLPSVVADASQIHQVLLNLCVNARDAMPKSGTLSISTRTVKGEAVSSRFAKATGYPMARQYVEIEVTDTGIGMDEATRRRIFEPFFTTKPPGKGTGLGLAVVYGILEHHTGFIDVRSAPGEGTSFTVYLPIPERTLEEVQVARKSLEEIPGGTETILIIEDEETLRELLKASLVSKGYTVLTAEDGMQGVEMYQNNQKEIAVVLSDMGLPLLSGQDVFRKIREINPKAKVIFASGFLDPEMKAEMYKAGLKEFIQKPYMQDEVLQKIREAIDTNG